MLKTLKIFLKKPFPKTRKNPQTPVKIFPSFSRTLKLIHTQCVSDTDLDTGLFCFGCVREHAFFPWLDEVNELDYLQATSAEKQAIHVRLLQALKLAESEGRCLWRTIEEYRSWQMVNEFLIDNGFSELPYPHPSQLCSNRDLVKAAKRSKQNLTVMYFLPPG